MRPVNKVFNSFIISAFFTSSCSMTANDLFLQKGHYSITYDHLTLPQNETMGLLGTNYLYDFKNNTYFGLGIYSAISGQRGGFFTGGFEAGYKYELLKNMYLDTSVFVGGGGGGAAPQGGGLMLRPSSGLLWNFDEYRISLKASKVKFPNGDINSDQISLGLEIPFESVFKTNNKSKLTKYDINNFIKTTGKEIGWSDVYFSPVIQTYFLPSGVKNTQGKEHNPNMHLIGFEFGKKYKRNTFYFFETAGAGGGDADGYAQVLGGIGITKPVTNSFGAVAKVSLGAAGGGKVDTGGGLVHKQSLGAYFSNSRDTSFNVEIGSIQAIDGEFEAYSSKVALNFATRFLSTGKSIRSINGFTNFDNNEWNIRIVNQTYLGDKSIRKNQTDDTPVDLVGLKLDRYINEHLYFTGQALGAYKGKSGGYASGLLGLGLRKDLNNFTLFTEACLGVGGGGNVATGSGLIIQPSVGIGYKLSQNLEFQASYGNIKSFNGNIDTSVVDFGFNYKFQTIE